MVFSRFVLHNFSVLSLLMADEIHSGRVAPSTGITAVGFLTCMSTHMDPHVDFSRKSFVAELALNGFVAEMGASVDNQILSSPERLAADIAGVGLLARMDPHVNGQVGAANESLVALIALVAPVVLVVTHMEGQILLCGQRHRALLTFVCLLSAVTQLVLRETHLQAKGPAAYATSVRFLAGVETQVILHPGETLEGFAAEVTRMNDSVLVALRLLG